MRMDPILSAPIERFYSHPPSVFSCTQDMQVPSTSHFPFASVILNGSTVNPCVSHLPDMASDNENRNGSGH